MASVMLREQLSKIFSSLQQRDKALTPYKLSLNVGLDPNHLRQALQGTRPFSDAMLEKLASVPELGLSLGQLIAWRLLDENKDHMDALLLACEMWKEKHGE